MTRFAPCVVALAALLAASGGCSYHAFSPPARAINMETAAPVKPGETTVGARGGIVGALFEPGAAVGTAIVRHGVAPDVEVNGEATYAYVLLEGQESTANINQNAGATRIGVKAGNQYAAFTGGLGGGLSAMGGFTAADAGLIFSFANCYVVPFVSTVGFVSTPVGAKSVTFYDGRTSKPGTSFGYGAAAGIEVPLDHARCRAGRTPPRFQLGANVLSISGLHESAQAGTPAMGSAWDQHATVGLMAGVEFPLNQ
jgi:hypothetical protein